MAQKTPLHAWHAAHDGRMVDFAGWELPVNYAPGVVQEHLATRAAGGLFDTSHMGRFRVSGPAALSFLDRVLTNAARKLAPGRAQYTLISDQAGQPRDDAFLYMTGADDYLLVVNASNAAADWAWLSQANQEGAALVDVSGELAMIALQGQASERVLAALAPGGLPPAGRNRAAWVELAGRPVFVSRTGYTGEPLGFEIFPPAESAEELWQALVEEGAAHGVLPVGLGARDTLRLEAGLPLYGHEYAPDRPILSVPTARFGVSLDDGRADFLGREALLAQRRALAEDPAFPRLVSIVATQRGMMREHSPVRRGGAEVGVLTSGTTVPAWRFKDGRPGEESHYRTLGLALVSGEVAPGEAVEVEYRGRPLACRVVESFVTPAGDHLVPAEV